MIEMKELSKQFGDIQATMVRFALMGSQCMRMNG